MGQACRRTFVVVVVVVVGGRPPSPEEERRRRRRRRLRGRGGGGRARLRGGQQCEGILVNKRFPGLSRTGGGGGGGGGRRPPSLPPSSSSTFVPWGFVCPPGSGGLPRQTKHTPGQLIFAAIGSKFPAVLSSFCTPPNKSAQNFEHQIQILICCHQMWHLF